MARDQGQETSRADTHIRCHVIWRQEERIGVAFD
jgi:hypothetical protein